MRDDVTLTKVDSGMLAGAFPKEYATIANAVAAEILPYIERKSWVGYFYEDSRKEGISIPFGLYFKSEPSVSPEEKQKLLFVRALQSRSSDGFERQRAARYLLENFEPCCAPFIVALIGNHVIEILDEIAAAMTPEIEHELGAFIIDNEGLWKLTKSRMVSYWNVHYRAMYRNDTGRMYPRADYIGFKLTDRLDAAAFGRGSLSRS